MAKLNSVIFYRGRGGRIPKPNYHLKAPMHLLVQRPLFEGGGRVTDVVFQSKKIARRGNTNVIATAS